MPTLRTRDEQPDEPAEQPQGEVADRDVEVDDRVVPPKYWMRKGDGEVVAATSETDRVNLSAVGYRIVHDTPPGMPAATGGFA